MRFKRRVWNRGDQRIYIFFALFPVCIDGDVRWLERVSVLQEFRIEDSGSGPYWKNLEFVGD